MAGDTGASKCLRLGEVVCTVNFFGLGSRLGRWVAKVLGKATIIR